ncbi:hypothetical protein TPHV1_210105 [Treponema phagedenis]|uniref:Uncharacterized protein n=1 Tax=Treponema phagedenis TaxID=162 RepID=A0A0B7GWD8_TREPH|nr:hypothetical protein TPHV1_210105 [Treponema phagedenis]
MSFTQEFDSISNRLHLISTYEPLKFISMYKNLREIFTKFRFYVLYCNLRSISIGINISAL